MREHARQNLLLIASLALNSSLLGGCQFLRPFMPGATAIATSATSTSRAQITIQRIASVTSAPGTARLLGSVRLPAGLLDGSGPLGALTPLQGATLILVGENGARIDHLGATTDAKGEFDIPDVPIGVPMDLVATYQAPGGKIWTLRKFLLPTDTLACGHTDLATTLTASELQSPHPVVTSDSGLDGADLFELVDPIKILPVEDEVRNDLATSATLTRAAIALGSETSALASDRTYPLFEELAQADTILPQTLDSAFQRPDAAVGLRITALGYNDAGLDWQITTGIIRITVAEAPLGIARMEYWLDASPPLLAATGENSADWQATIDTNTLPNGHSLLLTVGVDSKGNKRLIGQSALDIENSVDTYCPPP